MEKFKSLDNEQDDSNLLNKDFDEKLAALQDAAGRFKQKRETVRSQEQLVKNLSDQIRANTMSASERLEKNVLVESRQRQMEVDGMRFQRAQLQEKLKQLKLLGKMNQQGRIAPAQVDQLNRTFQNFGVRPDETDKLIKESERVKELKAREDNYYDQI